MRNFIFKFVPNDNSKSEIIHKVKIPDFSEKGFYRETTSFNAFCSGKRANATKEDKNCYRDTCPWAPDGLYYNAGEESEWLKENTRRVNRLKKYGPPYYDEVKLKTICHENIYDFYNYIGFDRKRRLYNV